MQKYSRLSFQREGWASACRMWLPQSGLRVSGIVLGREGGIDSGDSSFSDVLCNTLFVITSNSKTMLEAGRNKGNRKISKLLLPHCYSE